MHLLIERVPVSSLVNARKGVSSRPLRQCRPDIRQRYWRGVLWSPSYFAAACGRAPISIVRRYIEQQKTPDQTAAAASSRLAVALSISGKNAGAFRISW